MKNTLSRASYELAPRARCDGPPVFRLTRGADGAIRYARPSASDVPVRFPSYKAAYRAASIYNGDPVSPS